MKSDKIREELHMLIDKLRTEDLNTFRELLEEFIREKSDLAMERQEDYQDDYTASLTDEDRKEIEAAIQESLDDIKAGRVYSSVSVMKEMRKKYGSH